MTKNYSKACMYTLLVAWGIMPATSPLSAYAADSQNHADSILSEMSGYLTETGQESLSVADSAAVPIAPEFIGWNVTWVDLYENWGVDHQFAGHKLTVKLGFVRGVFDAYTQTYKAEPVIKLIDSSDNLTYPYLRVGPSKNYIGGSLDVRIEFNGQTVDILNYKNTAERVKIPYADLLAKWTAYASRNCSNHLGKKYCLVPQYLWDGARRYGFVATANTPLYYTTNLPQDYVELYKEEAGTINYKPIAYSLALRLAFVLSPDQRDIWEIRVMTPEEIGEAMLERSKTRTILCDNLLPTTGVKR